MRRTFRSFGGRGGVMLLHAAAFLSGGAAMSAVLSLPPAAQPVVLYSSSSSSSLHLRSTSSSSSSSSSSLTANSFALTPSSSPEPSPRPSSASLPRPTSTNDDGATQAPVPSSVFSYMSFLRPRKSKASSPHFAFGELPLFAKASLTIGDPERKLATEEEEEEEEAADEQPIRFEIVDGFDDDEDEDAGVRNGRSTMMRLSLQLRRSPKTVDEIEEEYYWQEGEEQDDEDW